MYTLRFNLKSVNQTFVENECMNLNLRISFNAIPAVSITEKVIDYCETLRGKGEKKDAF